MFYYCYQIDTRATGANNIFNYYTPFFKPKPLTIIILGIFLAIAAIRYYDLHAARNQYGDDDYYHYFPSLFYLW